MEFHSGRTRIAISFPKLGFVLKFPKSRPIEFIKFTISTLRLCYGLKNLKWIKRRLSLKEEDAWHGNIRDHLLNGVYQNWLERSIWKDTRSIFLEPTWFSLFGLVNLQRYGTPNPLTEKCIWIQIYEITESQAQKNNHHFQHPANYSFDGRHLRMFDYGDTDVRTVIEKYGEKLFHHEYRPIEKQD